MPRRFLGPVVSCLALITTLVWAVPNTAAAAAPGLVAGRFPTAEAFVDQAYRDILDRGPDTAGLEYWTDLLERGVPPISLLSFFMFSPEFEGQVAPIARLHLVVFGRLPTGDELRSGTLRTRQSEPLETYAARLLDSDEFRNRGGNGAQEAVRLIHQAAGRSTSDAAIAPVVSRIGSGDTSLEAYAAQVAESADHVALSRPEVATSTVFLALLRRAPDPGGLQYWADLLRNGLNLDIFVDSVIRGPEYQSRFPAPPSVTESVAASGLTIPWDVLPLEDGSLLVSERGGRFVHVSAAGEQRTIAADLSDLFASGETGLMGLALDPAFGSNNRFYSCQGHTSPREIQVISWQLSPDRTSATRIADPLVSGLPIVSGRHGGCQLGFDVTGALVVGTGDAATGTNPQDLTSLGGKVLRVDAATGGPAAGNPFSDSANLATRLVYSYGHRNIQGISIHPDTGQIWTAEHGPSRDDEINAIIAGGNYGWNPVPGYNEAVPMTDLAEFPGAVPARASTGAPTLAFAGAAFLDHSSWGSWNGALAVASLKNRSLRLYLFNDVGQSLGQTIVLSGTYGRLRAVEASGGSLYITTSNGGGADRVIRLSASS